MCIEDGINSELNEQIENELRYHSLNLDILQLPAKQVCFLSHIEFKLFCRYLNSKADASFYPKIWFHYLCHENSGLNSFFLFSGACFK